MLLFHICDVYVSIHISRDLRVSRRDRRHFQLDEIFRIHRKPFLHSTNGPRISFSQRYRGDFHSSIVSGKAKSIDRFFFVALFSRDVVVSRIGKHRERVCCEHSARMTTTTTTTTRCRPAATEARPQSLLVQRATTKGQRRRRRRRSRRSSAEERRRRHLNASVCRRFILRKRRDTLWYYLCVCFWITQHAKHTQR